MKKLSLLPLLLLALAIPATAPAIDCPIFTAGSKTYITDLNTLSAGCTPTLFTPFYSSSVAGAAVSTWTRTASGGGVDVDVAWSPTLGLFAATGAGGTIRTSPDGATWTIRSSPNGSTWHGIVWAPELALFVAVGGGGGTSAAMTSSDGITWSAHTTPGENFDGVTWSPQLGLLVAVAYSGTGQRVITSTDGSTWTARATPADNDWAGVAWSPELALFVAVANSGTGDRVMRSANGTTWVIGSVATDRNWDAVVWASQLRLFVAVSYSGTADSVMTSPDGISWTLRTTPTTKQWTRIAWSPELGLLAATSYVADVANIMTSSDGISWVTRTTESAAWGGIAWSPELSLFCATSWAGDSMVSTQPIAKLARNTILKTGTGTTYVTNAGPSIATLNLQAGSTAASKAPLKFTSGPLQTAAEVGAIEFLTDAYYATITTAAARKQFLFTDGSAASLTGTAAGLTAGNATNTTSNSGTGAYARVTDPAITSITPGADFTLKQNSVTPFTSENTGAIANTLYLKAGNVGMGTTTPGARLHVGATVTNSTPTNTYLILGDANSISTTVPVSRITMSAALDANYGSWIGTFWTNVSGTTDLRFGSRTGGTDTTTMTLTSVGNVGIGTTSPTAVVHMKAGTTAANTAPLKLTSGSLQTTAEAGAVEFLTDAFYATITTGAERKSFAFGPAAGPITFTGPTVARSIALPDASFTVARSDAAQILTGVQTFEASFVSAGSTVAALPAGVAGARRHVTDQLTTCAVPGAALTGGGALNCPAFHNGLSWVGG